MKQYDFFKGLLNGIGLDMSKSKCKVGDERDSFQKYRTYKTFQFSDVTVKINGNKVPDIRCWITGTDYSMWKPINGKLPYDGKIIYHANIEITGKTIDQYDPDWYIVMKHLSIKYGLRNVKFSFKENNRYIVLIENIDCKGDEIFSV